MCTHNENLATFPLKIQQKKRAKSNENLKGKQVKH